MMTGGGPAAHACRPMHSVAHLHPCARAVLQRSWARAVACQRGRVHHIKVLQHTAQHLQHSSCNC